MDSGAFTPFAARTRSRRKGPKPLRLTVSRDIPIVGSDSDSGSESALPPSKSPQPFAVTTKNRFEVLEGQETKGSQNVAAPVAKKERPPPPVIIHGKVREHNKLIVSLKKVCVGEVLTSYSEANTNIFVKTKSDWLCVRKFLEETRQDFHTYTHASDKTHAFVVRGLDYDIETKDIVDELNEVHKLEVTAVYLLRNTRRPAYMVVTRSECTLRHLEREVRSINYTRVSWSRYRNSRLVLQCHRCQAWQHATTNCRAAQACMKCSGPHQTKECTAPEAKAKCINCGLEHFANSTECAAYKKALKTQQNKKKMTQQPAEVKKTDYVPAPPPAVNAWTQRTSPATAPAPAAAQSQLGNKSSGMPAPGMVTGPPTAAPRTTRPSSSKSAPPPLMSLALNQNNLLPPLISAVPQVMCAPSQNINTNNNLFTGPNTGNDDFNNVMDELRQLNEQVNVSAMLRALRDLNTALRGCSNAMEKFQVFWQFQNNIASYGI